MSFPKILFLILFSILAATNIGTTAGNAQKGGGSFPQRLRVRLEPQRLRTGDATKVIVEFLDRNYGQVVNDATRVIVLGQATTGSRLASSGSGYFDNQKNYQKIEVKPGEWSRTVTFTSSGPGRLFITANSEGLEGGQALVLITSDKSASLFSRFLSLFETTAHAQDDDLSFEILPKQGTATAGGQHRATFTLAFLTKPDPGTRIRITTNLTEGGIYFKDQRKDGPVADITLGENDDICQISVYSARDGDFDIKASVHPNGAADQARVQFNRASPTRIIFDAEPTEIDTEPTSTPLTVRLADDGGFPIPADRERTINFSCATDGDQVSFEPKTVILAPNQTSAQVVFRLEKLPPGNELKLLATSDSGLHAGTKGFVIKSAIEKLLIAGPEQVHCGGNEGEFVVSLGGKNDNHLPADWDRQIDLHVSGGTLTKRRIEILRGQPNAVFSYTSPSGAGKYVLTASSRGIQEGVYTINVTHKGSWLTMIALLGGLVGGVARQFYRYKKLGRILPRWHGNHWDLGFVRRLVGSLVGAFFFYWTFKFGLQEALGSPVLPVTVDMGSQPAAFFFGGIGGYAGTYVLEKLAHWFLPKGKRQAAPAQ